MASSASYAALSGVEKDTLIQAFLEQHESDEWAEFTSLSSGLAISTDLNTVVSNRQKQRRLLRSLNNGSRKLIEGPDPRFRKQLGEILSDFDRISKKFTPPMFAQFISVRANLILQVLSRNLNLVTEVDIQSFLSDDSFAAFPSYSEQSRERLGEHRALLHSLLQLQQLAQQTLSRLGATGTAAERKHLTAMHQQYLQLVSQINAEAHATWTAFQKFMTEVSTLYGLHMTPYEAFWNDRRAEQDAARFIVLPSLHSSESCSSGQPKVFASLDAARASFAPPPSAPRVSAPALVKSPEPEKKRYRTVSTSVSSTPIGYSSTAVQAQYVAAALANDAGWQSARTYAKNVSPTAFNSAAVLASLNSTRSKGSGLGEIDESRAEAAGFDDEAEQPFDNDFEADELPPSRRRKLAEQPAESKKRAPIAMQLHASYSPALNQPRKSSRIQSPEDKQSEEGSQEDSARVYTSDEAATDSDDKSDNEQPRRRLRPLKSPRVAAIPALPKRTQPVKPAPNKSAGKQSENVESPVLSVRGLRQRPTPVQAAPAAAGRRVWTAEDENALLNAIELFGMQWAKIRDHCPSLGRSDVQIKDKFRTMQRSDAKRAQAALDAFDASAQDVEDDDE